MPFNIACIDGSLQNLGLAVLTVDGDRIVGLQSLKLNKTKPSTDKKKRKSYDDLARFKSHWDFLNVEITKWDCKLAVGEVPSGAQDARAAFAFGGVTALYACSLIPFIPVYPLEVKEAATGFKHADKEDMIEWAFNSFPSGDWITNKRANKMNITTKTGLFLTNDNEHLADAVGVGFAGMKYLSQYLPTNK